VPALDRLHGNAAAAWQRQAL